MKNLLRELLTAYEDQCAASPDAELCARVRQAVGEGPYCQCPLGDEGVHRWTAWDGRQCEYCMLTKAEAAKMWRPEGPLDVVQTNDLKEWKRKLFSAAASVYDALRQEIQDRRDFCEEVHVKPLLSRTYPPLDPPELRGDDGQDLGINHRLAMEWLVQRSVEADEALALTSHTDLKWLALDYLKFAELLGKTNEEKRGQYRMLSEIRELADQATGIDRSRNDKREPGALGAVKALVAALNAEKLAAREGRAVAEVANRHGWNGVENSKLLSEFVERRLAEDRVLLLRALDVVEDHVSEYGESEAAVATRDAMMARFGFATWDEAARAIVAAKQLP